MERHLLLVDDEANVLSALKRALRRDGYTIHTADSGAQGLDLVRDWPIAVVISDQRMPYMTGSEFLAHARQIRPHSIRIMLSGFSEVQSLADAINEGAAWKFLFKPWEDDQLRAQVRAAFEHYELDETNRSLNAALQLAGEEMARLNEIMTQRFDQASTDLLRERTELIARWQYLPLAAVKLDAQGHVETSNARAGNLPPGSLLVNDWQRLAATTQGHHPQLGQYWLQPPQPPELAYYLLLYDMDIG
ncbi:Response regulator receiver domain-containing protein [Andreprevotia lacus DSM 23236]|jgi:response regulator RpfG family c-di-GMP phosphodiesterase|uniref:Response regulator receiver domain-containing protein n=1 Tax=Andreprevotia lacus DSM 23236 TaxID=1121001 RepID=A0A1W1XFQ2_9NEIS|nr:response regulator [Andreprevotia lacus]SMC22759.1 Response regulator receiver domain-containing protein [Andreprevotia lacus DSM 23236]